MKEREIQKSIIDYLKLKRYCFWRQNSGAMPTSNDGYCTRFISFGTPGAPDIFLVKGGKIYGLEVKTPKGKQNDNQIAFQDRFEEAGGIYKVVRSLDDVREMGL